MSEAFVSRWSRLKRETAVASPSPAPAQPTISAEHAAQPLAVTLEPVAVPAPSEALALPAIESLTAESDFAAFMQPKVPEALRRQALKKMFSNPHFNVMDGLDIYIDDYSVGTPIPQEWYKDMVAWQNILNPKEAIITEHGYAVEPDSEEGRAILAAREQAEAERLASSEPDAQAPIVSAPVEQAPPTPQESDASTTASPETETK